MLCVSCFPKFQMAKEGFYCQYSILLYCVLSMCWGQGEGLGSEGNNSSINENVTWPWRLISRLNEQHCIILPKDGRLCIEWNFVFLFWREVRETIRINTYITRDESANESLGSIHPFSNNPPLPLILNHENPNVKHILQFPMWLSVHSLKWIESRRDMCNEQVTSWKSWLPSVVFFLLPACWEVVTTGKATLNQEIEARCWRQ